MTKKVIYIVKLLLLFLSIMLGSMLIVFFSGYYIYSQAPLWRTITPIPAHQIVTILGVGMIPMGHIDNAYVLTKDGLVFLWERESSAFNNGRGEWRKITDPPGDAAIVDLKKFSAWPHYGIYIKTDKGNYFAYKGYDADLEAWEMITQEEYLMLPNQTEQPSSSKENTFWPKVIEPHGTIIDREAFYASGSMSEEARNYCLMEDGSLKILSRTFSLFSVMINMALGFVLGIFVNTIVFALLFIRKRRVHRKSLK